MKSYKHIETWIGQLRMHIDSQTRSRLYTPIKAAWHQRQQKREAAVNRPHTGVLTLKIQLTIAALILLIVALSIHIMDRSVMPAYGLDLTAQAVEDIRYFHFVYRRGPARDIQKEAWVEYDPNGELLNVRVNFYMTNNMMVWSEGITQYLRPQHNNLLIFEDQEYTDKILFFANRYDPKHAIAYLRALQHKGDVKISYEERREPNDPILFTVAYEPNTYVIGTPKPAMKEKIRIDSLTKLISQIEIFFEKDGQFLDGGVWEYIDYNQPVSPACFILENEMPQNCVRFNTVGMDLGLEQGTLSDQEIAVKLVETFLNAWIKKAYERAVRIYGYSNPETRERVLKIMQLKTLLEVIEIGSPRKPEAPKRGLMVPFTVEAETNGERVNEHFEVHVRPSIPGRWSIISGLTSLD